jgi:hypothetical protein
VPVILGSDKTTVSVATGHNEYWPLYALIGNIHNNIRRAHGEGLVLVGFLSIPKGIPFSILTVRDVSTLTFFHQLTRLKLGL